MMTFGDMVLTIVVVKLNISEAKFNFTVALSGNADILGIFW
jgi:hypothetical protein